MKKEKEPTNKEILTVINKFSTSVDGQFGSVKKDIDGVKKDIDGVKKDIDGVKKDIRQIRATMVTRDYLDDKLADLRGDMVVLMRKEDKKLGALVEVLLKRKLISEEDTKTIFSMEPFPKISM